MSPWWLKPTQTSPETGRKLRYARAAQIGCAVVGLLLGSIFIVRHALRVYAHATGNQPLSGGHLAEEIISVCVWLFLLVFWLIVYVWMPRWRRKALEHARDGAVPGLARQRQEEES